MSFKNIEEIEKLTDQERDQIRITPSFSEAVLIFICFFGLWLLLVNISHFL
ncbi:MAG: hypothetical protein KDF58_00265 [Alphaproteobacteria bacterium]|nr:hypothetical protein [Alphaproteobacteria bacterium]HPF46450.1 hypothetical protein [Emcibacteraceae bacterium]HRW29045.1 hypothetical protein [Emcibacteraceae bacterium]